MTYELIQLDQSRSYVSVFGSEQLLDVELDRNIPLLPVPKGSPPPLSSLDRLSFDSPLHSIPQSYAGHGDTPATKDEGKRCHVPWNSHALKYMLCCRLRTGLTRPPPKSANDGKRRVSLYSIHRPIN